VNDVEERINSPSQIAIRPLRDRDADRWQQFVRECAEASLFHRIEWKNVLEGVFGHRPHYLLAERGTAIVGVLPLAEVRSLLFGHALVSLPFAVYGGAAVADEAAREALHGAAVKLGRELGVRHVELRNRLQCEPEWPRQDLYATFRRTLFADADANFAAIPGKRRNMIRKAEKGGLRAEVEAKFDRLYPLYADNVHRHGTPPVSRRYFEEVARALGRDQEVLTVVNSRGRPLASAFLMYFRDEVTPYYVGDCLEGRQMAANDFMYWQIMRRAVERGCRVFDWSRSKKGTGSYEFKKLWGFEPTPLHYHYALLDRDGIPQNNPLNPKYRALIAVWRRLPLPVVNAIGPYVVRALG
jgi:FemAB-related protein (PEP-CTERM system-associated)